MANKTNTKKNIKTPCEEKIDCKTLVIEETEYITTLTKKFENRKIWKAPDPKIVMSVIPGTILNVFVKEGDKLKEGDPLVILEAMKMRNEVNMPMDGIIKTVNVKEGEKVPKGHLIVDIV
jgi:biotin carboxyl carrier protein